MLSKKSKFLKILTVRIILIATFSISISHTAKAQVYRKTNNANSTASNAFYIPPKNNYIFCSETSRNDVINQCQEFRKQYEGKSATLSKCCEQITQTKVANCKFETQCMVDHGKHFNFTRHMDGLRGGVGQHSDVGSSVNSTNPYAGFPPGFFSPAKPPVVKTPVVQPKKQP